MFKTYAGSNLKNHYIISKEGPIKTDQNKHKK